MKQRTFRTVRTALYLAGASVLLTEPVSAYIDPATTSYVVQIVAGIVIACGTVIGIVWNKMKRKIKKKDAAEQEPVQELRSGEHGGVMTAEELLADDETDDSSDKTV